MVSLRRRRLLGYTVGVAPLMDPLPNLPRKNVSEDPEQVNKGKEILAKLPGKKPKVFVQIHPESPLEVHAYLTHLKERKKLDIGLLQRSEEIPVKEWMESYYPHIFGVFPQDPKLVFQCPDKGKQSEFLYCYYCLFLFEVRNIVFMDFHVSPEYVESLGNVMKVLEKQGFDCRFMRSELVVAGNMMKKKKEVTLAEKRMIATKTMNLEERLRAAVTEQKEKEMNDKGKQTEGMTTDIGEFAINKLPADQHKSRLNLRPYSPLELECLESVLDCHKKMFVKKQNEWGRLSRVLEKMDQLHRGKAAFPGK